MRVWKILLVLVFCVSQIAGAVSIAPEIIESLKQSGQLASIVEADRQARANGVWQPNPYPMQFGTITDIDTLHCLIILVDFSDMQHEWVYHSEPEDFDTLLFSIDIRQPGSMTDYYDETSYNQAFLMGQVTAWYRMPQTYAYYVDGQRGFGSYPHNAQKLTEDAVVAADPDVDFSLYDNDADGWVDALFVVHAGPGYEDTGNLNYIHSHAWVISDPMSVDGVQVYGYSMEPEETGGGGFATIGVYCHEFGHVLGLPDLYDYDYDSDGVGMWSIMAGGSWGGGGGRPVHFDGWCKTTLGWVNPSIVGPNLDHEQIDAVEYSPDVYILYSLGMPDAEYFLVENRQRELFDFSLPGPGLLVYHIDENVPDNNNQNHYKVAVEQADGRRDLENNRGSDTGDPWPGNLNRRTFDDNSNPNSHLYGNMISEVAVSEISDSDSVMFADLAIMYDNPFYLLHDHNYDDSRGNDNGQPEAGESVDLFFTAENVRALENSLTVIARCDDPLIVFTDSTSVFSNVPVNEPFSNQLDPMTFSVSAGYTSNFVNFTLLFVARGGEYTQEFTWRSIIGSPQILLVDDDNGASIDTFYTKVLDSLRQPYILWSVSGRGTPAGVLEQYENVIWFTGDTRPQAPLESDVTALINYLDGGGHLIITSQDFVQRLSERGSTQDTILLHQYLKAGYHQLETDHHPIGVSGSPFSGYLFITSGSGGANNQLWQDAITVFPGGIQMLSYRSGRLAAVASIGNYKTLTIGFGFEGINDLLPDYYDSRATFMQAALTVILNPQSVSDGTESLPENALLSQNYPNPFNARTIISFDMVRAGHACFEIFDLLGRVVDTPLDGMLQAGRHDVVWDAADRPSGLYFYRLVTPHGQATRKMILAK